MLKTLFEEQRIYLNHFFDRIDLKNTQELLERLLNCKGAVIFTGVGKSGAIASKLSMTFLSLGIASSFLPPTNALHGDIGMLKKDDLLILLSKSGETQELLHLIPHAKKKGSSLVAIVSHKNSTLAKEADLEILLPMERELCPFNLVPTTSTSLQLIFGDVLAIALMKAKKMPITQFAENHPLGTLGKKTSLFVKDLMLNEEESPLCSPEEKLLDLLHLLSSKRCGALIIIDKQKTLLGIFTDGDLRRALEAQGSSCLEKKIQELMNSSPQWTSPQTLAWDALQEMEKNPSHLISVLPVVDKDCVIGTLRLHDILQAGLRN